MEVYNERIDKILSAAAKLTRSEARKAVKSGRVCLDGVTIKDFGQKVTQNNIITLDNNVITYSKYIYVLLNKPAGYVCSTDERDGIPILDLFVNEFGSRDVSPVGRLDKNTTGSILLTDNGVLGHQLLSPSKHVDKVYLCTTCEPIKDEYVSLFAKGVDIGEPSPTLPATLVITGTYTALLTVSEGKFHQVKRMFEAVGNKIAKLHRVSFATLEAGTEADEGKWRYLEPTEIERLFDLAGNKAQ